MSNGCSTIVLCLSFSVQQAAKFSRNSCYKEEAKHHLSTSTNHRFTNMLANMSAHHCLMATVLKTSKRPEHTAPGISLTLPSDDYSSHYCCCYLPTRTRCLQPLQCPLPPAAAVPARSLQSLEVAGNEVIPHHCRAQLHMAIYLNPGTPNHTYSSPSPTPPQALVVQPSAAAAVALLLPRVSTGPAAA